MFCNGICEKKGKKCGLLYDVIMEHASPTGQKSVETITQCALKHIVDSLVRQEYGQVRVQAAVESSRNQKADDDNKASHIMATGFVGLIEAVNVGNMKKPLELENKK